MARPLLVLVSGHPGAGKTTLGRALGDAMHLPHLNRDLIANGLWHTAPDVERDPRDAWDVFASAIELYLASDVSAVADQTLYRGMAAEIRMRFVPLGDVVNVHCRSTRAYDRWRAKILADAGGRPFDFRSLDERVRRQRDEFTDPLPLGVPVIEVETSDGYDPQLERLVELIGDSRS